MCETVRMKDGTVATVCFGHRRRQQKCACGRPSTLQCDYPTEAGRTCDKYLCRGCAVPVGRNRDYCKTHPVDQGALTL